MKQDPPADQQRGDLFLLFLNAEQSAQNAAQRLGASDHNYLHIFSPAFPFSVPSYAGGRQNVPAGAAGISPG